ncbi:hypothetical protein CCHR01_18036 [Colletotrichum chrysophilum]|uniref:Uncharacterized protein n=1 Tax=Colletotrichum chrysophilum TaxID=1836956 RepID=A0AAD9A0V0_9PEZI|nr:hypothetical protein CCHR01_18036 [Colletotrichum chrysophilum]
MRIVTACLLLLSLMALSLLLICRHIVSRTANLRRANAATARGSPCISAQPLCSSATAGD